MPAWFLAACLWLATFAWPGDAIAVAAEKLGLTLSGRVMLGRVAYQCTVQAIADGASLVGEATLVREPALRTSRPSHTKRSVRQRAAALL